MREAPIERIDELLLDLTEKYIGSLKEKESDEDPEIHNPFAALAERKRTGMSIEEQKSHHIITASRGVAASFHRSDFSRIKRHIEYLLSVYHTRKYYSDYNKAHRTGIIENIQRAILKEQGEDERSPYKSVRRSQPAMTEDQVVLTELAKTQQAEDPDQYGCDDPDEVYENYRGNFGGLHQFCRLDFEIDPYTVTQFHSQWDVLHGIHND